MNATTIGDLLLSISGSLAASIVLKATVTTALTLILVRLARRARAAVRHVMLASALAVLLVLPILAVTAPAIAVAVPVAARTALPLPEVTAGNGQTIAGLATSGPIEGERRSEVRPALLSPATVAGVWIAGMLLFLLPIPIALGKVRSLRMSSAAWAEGQSIVDAMAAEIGVPGRVDVLLNDSLPGPMTCGVRRPAILLPADAESWTSDDLCRAVVHELEHVRRRDWLLLCVARAICATYWFHPLVWATRRHLALEAERACDDAVLRRAVAVDYADQLVALARRISAAPAPPALAMAGRADLAARVGAVLDVRQRRGRAGATWVVTACAASALIATTMSPLKIVAAQAAAPQQPADASQKFAVASIRPCTTGEVIRPQGGGGRSGGYGGGRFDTSPDTLNIQCMTVEGMAYLGYVAAGTPLLNTAREDNTLPVTGGPDWVHSERWTIEAKASGPTERRTMLRTMLPALLEERFELKHHRATEERPMYALVVARSGLKIAPMKPGECSAVDASSSRVMPEEDKYWCGALIQVGDNAQRMVKMGATTLKDFASAISTGAGRYVLDKTGITDQFNITFRFAPADAPASESTTAESIFTALEKQLGLRLEPTRGPAEHLVIDSAVRPKHN